MYMIKQSEWILVSLQFLLIVIGQDVAAQDNWECSSPCKCKWVSGKKTAECVAQNIIQIPNFLSPEIQYLDLTENPISHLHEFAFSQVKLVNLQKLTLRQCTIETIDEKAFKGLKIVVEIDLTGNKLKFIQPGTFNETNRLRVLLLSKNHLEILNNGLFDNLMYLQKVDLSHNRIHRIEDESFQNLPGLQTLALNDNNISEFKLTTFKMLPKLGSLELHNNPWNCNCFLKELRDWTIKRKLYTKQTTCKYPLKLSGKRWDEVGSEEFACQPKIQIIIPSSKIIQIEKGKTVRLDCLAVGVPSPRTHWVHRSRILNNSTKRHSSSAVTTSTTTINTNINNTNQWMGYIVTENFGWVNLTIPNVTITDKGQYACITQSPGGSVEENVTMIIIGDEFNDEGGVLGHHWINLPLVLGISVALLLLLVVAMTLCALYCRRRQANLLHDKKGHQDVAISSEHNDSLDQQGFGELEKSLITSVDPIGGEITTRSIVVKPFGRYDTPSVTSHGTEMTELNRTLLDADSVYVEGVGRIIANGIGDINQDDDEDNDDRIQLTPELESATIFHGSNYYGNNSFNGRQYPPDLLAFSGGRGSPTSQASTTPDNSRLFNQYLIGQFGGSSSPQYLNSGGSGFKTLPHNRSGTPYSSTGGGNNSIIPALSRQGYVTIPRRPRAPSWSSGPPISPVDIGGIEPVYDNLGKRTTADGSSAISLNKNPEILGASCMSGSDGCNRNLPLSTSVLLNNPIQHYSPNIHINNNNNVDNSSNQNAGDDNNVISHYDDDKIALDRLAPEGAAERSIQQSLDKVEYSLSQKQNDNSTLEKKIPPRPPPKPKKKHINGPLYEDEGEDGTEV